MNFENVEFLGKGTTRKSQEGTVKEVNFHLAYVNYTKNTKNGDVEVNHFAFSETGMRKFGLDNPEVGLTVVNTASGKFIALVPQERATFLAAAKRGENKAKNVSVPTLTNALLEKGVITLGFQGRQYLNLVQVGEQEGIVFFDVVPAEVAPKAYVASEDAKEDANEATLTTSNGAEEGY